MKLTKIGMKINWKEDNGVSRPFSSENAGFYSIFPLFSTCIWQTENEIGTVDENVQWWVFLSLLAHRIHHISGNSPRDGPKRTSAETLWFKHQTTCFSTPVVCFQQKKAAPEMTLVPALLPLLRSACDWCLGWWWRSEVFRRKDALRASWLAC